MWLPRRLRRDHEPRRDLPVRQPARDEPQHLDLACGQPGRPIATLAARGGRRPRAPRRPRRRRAGRPRTSARSSAAAVVRVARGAVRPRLAHRLVGVGGGEHRAPACEIAPPVSAARVARSRRAARGAAPRSRAERCQRRRLLQHPLGEVRVHPHPFPFAGAERSGLVPDRVRDAEPAETVHEAGPAQRRHLVVGSPRSAPAAAASSATRARVPEHVRRLEVDEVGDRLERLRRTRPSRADAERRLGVDDRVPRARRRRGRGRSSSASAQTTPTSARIELLARAAGAPASMAAVDAADRWATSTNSASCDDAGRDRDVVAGAACRASPCRPTSRTRPPTPSTTSLGQAELLAASSAREPRRAGRSCRRGRDVP